MLVVVTAPEVHVNTFWFWFWFWFWHAGLPDWVVADEQAVLIERATDSKAGAADELVAVVGPHNIRQSDALRCWPTRWISDCVLNALFDVWAGRVRGEVQRPRVLTTFTYAAAMTSGSYVFNERTQNQVVDVDFAAHDCVMVPIHIKLDKVGVPQRVGRDDGATVGGMMSVGLAVAQARPPRMASCRLRSYLSLMILSCAWNAATAIIVGSISLCGTPPPAVNWPLWATGPL